MFSPIFPGRSLLLHLVLQGQGWNTNWIGSDYAFLGYINADHFIRG